MKNINAMKNINSFIKSHCGFGGISSVSRRYLVLLTALLSLGVGNVWGDTYYILGPDGSWDENAAHTMGSSGITNWVYKNLTPSGQWTSFKVYNKTTNTWYGKNNDNDNVEVGAEYTPSSSSSAENNYCDFTTNYSSMSYYFFFNTSTKKLMVQPDYYLAGDCGASNQSWGQTQNKTTYDATNGYFKWNTCSLNTSTVYNFKLSGYNAWTYQFEDWSGVTVSNGTKTSNNSGNIKFKSTHAGVAVITLNPTTNTMVINCPYQVSYAAGTGASGTVSASAVTTYGSTCTLSSSTFTRTGYTQDGWATTNGGAKVYNLGATYTDGYTDVTLYPHWVENSFNVSVSANSGGSVTPSGTVAVKQVTGTSITANPDDDHAFLNWTITDGGITPTSSSSNPQTFKATTTGGSIAANFQDRWVVRGTGGGSPGALGDWDTDIVLTKISENTYRSASITLLANTTYYFKVCDRQNSTHWYGKSGAILTRNSSTSSNTEDNLTTGGDSEKNITLTTDYAGSYQFTFNSSDKSIVVTFPEAYQIHFEIGADKGGKVTSGYPNAVQVETSTSVTSDVTWVKAGNKVTLTASQAKDYHTWYGWYSVLSPSKANPTTNRLTYSLTHTTPAITSASNKSFYAIYFENDYWISTYSENGSVTPSGGQNAWVNTPSGDFTATPSTGYKFDGWTIPANVTAASTYTSSSNPIKVNATNAATLQANFSPRYAVRVKTGGGDWSAESTNHLTGYGEGQIGYVDITLNANTDYEIQVYDRQTSTWYGGSVAQNIDYEHSGLETIYTIATTYTPYSVYLQSAAAGTYRFAWNLTGYKIAVQYPTSWFITSGQKTEGQDDNAGGSFTAMDGSNDVKGGKFVAEGASVTFSASPNTGYNFDGWYTNETCTAGKDANNPMTVSSITTDKTVYAKFVPKTYTITLTHEGTGYGSGGDATATASYNTVLPSATMPTAAAGYHFMGYFTEAAGAGTKFIDENGEWIAGIENYTNADKKWIQDGGIELFAYFKKAEITNIALDATVFDPVAAGETGWVIANPTLDPAPAFPIIICWELQYDNGSPVPERDPEKHTEGDTKPNQVRFSIAGLAAGSYKIKATLRAGSTCDATSLSVREVSFSIASGFTVTIQYKDAEGNTIATSTTTPGKATAWTKVTAPNIVGYQFSKWKAGDGITIDGADANGEKAAGTINFETTFNGTLTAQYTKKRVIYFNNTLNWSNVYVYFYKDGNYWDTSNGTGTDANYYNGSHNSAHKGQMQPVAEGSNIYYFDAEAASIPSGYTNVAFTEKAQDNCWYFYENNKVVRRGDYQNALPMFVPLADQTPVDKNNNTAKYYNEGYWMNYPENTGYALRLFNNSGVEIDSIPFEFTPDKAMPMSVEYILDGDETYQFKLYRTDGKWYGNNGTMKAGSSGDVGETSWEFKEKDNETPRGNCTINTNTAGTYTFTLNFGNKDGYNYLIGVHYPAAANDFQILYNDRATWSLGSAHDENWVHPSRIIRARENGVDTISFFVAKNNTPILKAQKVNSINKSTGDITWGSLYIAGNASQSLTVDSSAVYNFKVTQGSAGVITSIEKIGAYTGNYYIRSSALSNKWGNYVDNLDHRMTYSSFSESDANTTDVSKQYSHYKAKWCPRNTNIAFCIANDYSPCITDTLKQDVNNPYNNTDAEGTLNNDGDNNHSGSQAYLDRYSANVRFMWDRKTNKISRAYISAATSGLAQFLVLRAGQELHNENNEAISSSPDNSVLLSDNENWIYEARLMIKPGTRFKLYACYAKYPVDPASAQYFRGAYDSDQFSDDNNSVVLIGGTSNTYQLARIVYDFKTNRLIAAWMPSGEVSGTNEINADVMVIRDHQESARCITFRDASANLSKVKTVYGVMRFNRWILNNRQHPENQNKNEADLTHHQPLPVDQQKSTYERRLYFISFPFNVRVGDIFGFGTYGQYWVIQYYDGLNRAKNGYWSDSKPNWKYVSPSMVSQGYTLKANEGYILELNLNAMAADNTTFWSNGISTIELYFPSTVEQNVLKQTNCTIPALSDKYECKINRGTGTDGDRRVKDSYWRCIGVPSYNLYNSTLTDGSGNEIRWNTDYTWQSDDRAFPFIYVWNKTDNTLTPQSTSAFTFQPMHAYLTQIKSAIVWTAVSAKEVSPIVARRARKEADNEHEWRIELRQDSTFLDQTYVRMTDMEQVTDSFDFGQDLIKELNSRSNIYTYIGYEKVAANSMTVHSDQTTVIPVGLNIRADGEYTFAMPDGTSGVGVTLIDNVANTRTNLSALDYTVTLSAGEYTNRFFLEISPVQNTPTDLGNVQGDNVQGTKARKVMVDGILYIVKDGKMYDARGKLVR